MTKTTDYERLSIERFSEQNRAARDARYRTNIEFAIRQGWRLAWLVIAVVTAATSGPGLTSAIVRALPHTHPTAAIAPTLQNASR